MFNFLNFNRRALLALIHDIFTAIFAWYFAFLLRFNFTIPIEFFEVIKQALWIVLSVQIIAFIFFGLYRGTWRFASVLDLKRIFLAVFISASIVTFIFLLSNIFLIPRSVLIIDPILLILMMGGSRFIYRAFKEYQLYSFSSSNGKPVIIFGAGIAAISLVKDLAQSHHWRVVGILDDDDTMHGREIHGVKILGNITKLAQTVSQNKVGHVIIAKSGATHQERRKLIDAIRELGLEALTAPGIDDLMSGRINVSQIRPVDVEDLLGRDAVELDNTGLQHLITSHVIFVSGAGGSIGSELCRQIVKFNPSHLICLDISEYALYQLEQELIHLKLSVKLVYVLGDIKHADRLDKLFTKYKPKLVFHAAAYKHVPLMEHHNVSEAFNNNVIGTYT